MLSNPVATAVMLLQQREGGWPEHDGGLSLIQVWLHRPPRKSVEIYDIIVQAGFYLVVGYRAHCSRHSHMRTHTHAYRGDFQQSRLKQPAHFDRPQWAPASVLRSDGGPCCFSGRWHAESRATLEHHGLNIICLSEKINNGGINQTS